MKSAIVCSEHLHNVGDLALMLQCAHGCRTHLGIENIAVRQWGEPAAEVKAQLKLARVTIIAGKSLLKLFFSSIGRLVVVGGGQVIRDNASAPDLMAMAAAMEIARATGGKSAVLACGVSRLRHPVHKALWRRMLAQAAVVTTRDQASNDAIVELSGENVDSAVMADLAFLPSPLHDALRHSSDTERFGIIAPCLSAEEGRFIDAKTVARSAILVADRCGINHIYLVSHDSRADMDPIICSAIIREIKTAAPYLGTSHIASCKLADYTQAYADAGFVITNRLHSAIFGMLAGAPVVVLDDGGAKTLAAAARFDLLVGPATSAFDNSLIDRIAIDATARVFRKREAALNQARTDATSNFKILKECLDGKSE